MNARSAFLAVALLLGGCADPGHEYYPLAKGYWWQYTMTVETMDGTREQKMILGNVGATEMAGQTVYPRRSVEGYIFYFRPVEDGILRLADMPDPDAKRFIDTEVVYDNPGTSRRQPRDIERDQYVLRTPLEIGNSWVMESETATLEMSGPPFDTMYQLDIPVDITYRVASLTDRVDVPAGRFTDCLRIEGSGRSQINVKGHLGRIEISVQTTDWYAPGTGLIKSERLESTSSPVLREGSYLLELERYGKG